MIYLTKINHRGEPRIKVHFARSQDLISRIRSIQGRKWSQTKRCWHLPYSSQSFLALKNVFGESNLILPEKKKVNQKKAQIEYAEYYAGSEKRYKIIGQKILAYQGNDNWIKLYVPSNKKGWIEVLKNVNGRKWDVKNVCWWLPNVKQTYRSLKANIGLQHIGFDFKIDKSIPESYDQLPPKKIVQAKTTGFDYLNKSQQTAVLKLEEQLILKRLSISTLKSYRNHLVSIFRFYKNINPEDLTQVDIQKYVMHQIKFKKISESTQNSIINAIKSYWEKVLKRPKEKIEIPRPKKPKHLPNVFSQEEVIKLIESPTNIKHKLVLLLIYSAGLRLGEVVNIRVRDISVQRRAIFIKDGKGKKDRFVTLAEEVIPYLANYKSQYRPNYWLFEGNTGGKYSPRSVQSIFYKALETSRVFAYGTVHTLRHSYATHCIENGFSTALLQEALGHSSIKTTEKYLHITSDTLKSLKSPLDIIKGKK